MYIDFSPFCVTVLNTTDFVASVGTNLSFTGTVTEGRVFCNASISNLASLAVKHRDNCVPCFISHCFSLFQNNATNTLTNAAMADATATASIIQFCLTERLLSSIVWSFNCCVFRLKSAVCARFA